MSSPSVRYLSVEVYVFDRRLVRLGSMTLIDRLSPHAVAAVVSRFAGAIFSA